jgi:hypothetical protein
MAATNTSSRIGIKASFHLGVGEFGFMVMESQN